METKYQLNSIFSDAFEWLCKKREKHPPSSDIWSFRKSWEVLNADIINMFSDGSYNFSIQKKVTLSTGDTIAMWSSQDSLVLKVLTTIVQRILNPFLSTKCYHVKGNGGLKSAVSNVIATMPEYKFFYKTDVKSYYDSIDHYELIMRLHNYIDDPVIISYIWQFLNRTVEWGGLYQDVKCGVAKGASLSPLLGAFYLSELDEKMEALDIKYFRYMDDILVLSKSRWKLKKAIRILNRTFEDLKLEIHPEKTMIGRTERGFDFLGFYITDKVTVSKTSIERFKKRITRLYEQGADKERIGKYILKLTQWTNICNCRLQINTLMYVSNS